MFELDLECEMCGNTVKANQFTMRKERVTFEDKSHLVLTYFVCCECDNKIVVEINNDETQEISCKQKEMLRKAIAKRAKAKNSISLRECLKKNELKRLKKLDEELIYKRKVLVSQYQGLMYYDSTGEKKKLEVRNVIHNEMKL